MKKRPRGRAPHGSNGVPARWDTAVGWCDDLSADDTPPAQEYVDADADANLAGVNIKALTAERDQANQKVLNLQQEIKSLQEAVERRKLKAAEDTKELDHRYFAVLKEVGLCVRVRRDPFCVCVSADKGIESPGLCKNFVKSKRSGPKKSF